MASKLPSRILIAFSSILLVHACYSAHEHSLLPSSVTSSSPVSTTNTKSTSISSTTLPLDITIETIVSVTLLIIGIVSSGFELKPIKLRKYAGLLESTGVIPGDTSTVGAVEKGKGKSKALYGFLDDRIGFLDIRKQRKEFSEWVKELELKRAMEE